MPSLLLRHGRGIDPSVSLDAVADILVVDSRIATSEPARARPAGVPGVELVDAPGQLVVPGLLDPHADMTAGLGDFCVEADRPDEPHLDFQRVVAEDEPVVYNDVPPELPLDPGAELSVKADRVSLEYRRWLIELTRALRQDSDHLVAALSLGPGSAPTTGAPPGRRR